MNKIFQIGYSPCIPIKQGLQRDPTTSHSRLNHSTPLKIINLSLSHSSRGHEYRRNHAKFFFFLFFAVNGNMADVHRGEMTDTEAPTFLRSLRSIGAGRSENSSLGV